MLFPPAAFPANTAIIAAASQAYFVNDLYQILLAPFLHVPVNLRTYGIAFATP
jgi:hypothetical protein